MWQLFNREYFPVSISLEDYVKDWTKTEPVLETAESIFVDIGNGSINGTPVVPVGYEKEGTHYYFAKMIFDDENNIWTIYEMQ